MTDHPTPDTLGQFILGQLAATEMRDIAWHLLNGCAHCQQTTSTLWEPADSFADPGIFAIAPGEENQEDAGDGYDVVLDRVFEKVVVTEAVFAEQRIQGRSLLAELLQVPAERQHLMVVNCQRFRTISAEAARLPKTIFATGCARCASSRHAQAARFSAPWTASIKRSMCASRHASASSSRKSSSENCSS